MTRETAEKTFVFGAIAALAVLLLWRATKDTIPALDANGNQAAPVSHPSAQGVAYVTSNIPLFYPPPVAMNYLPTTSAPVGAVNTTPGDCQQC